MARTFYADNLTMLKACLNDMQPIEGMESAYRGVFLGTVMALDPCGRYHHCLSPNGATDRCESFWESLEKAATRLGGWIENGEGDPCDVFFCLPADEEGEETEGEESALQLTPIGV